MMRQTFHLVGAAALLLFALSIASASHAVDGVMEINHTCAVTGGCFPGDTAGYPVTIDGTSGTSYRVTSDLIVPDVNTTGITINASGVTLDLNGFEMRRAGCVHTFATCPFQSGAGAGITVDDPVNREANEVKNGAVTGMGAQGVLLGAFSVVRNVRAQWNSGDGIAAGAGSRLVDTVVTVNGGAGLKCTTGCSLRENVVTSNQTSGINIGFSSGYGDNVMSSNVGSAVASGIGVDLGGNVCNGVACP